jgi:protein RecA
MTTEKKATRVVAEKGKVTRRAKPKAAETSSDPTVSEPQDLYGVSDFGGETFSTGCTLLDCVLGGGWAHSRVINLVGDNSTGKTLLAIEACANFARENPEARIRFVEAEAAFDQEYAITLGLPADRVEFPNNIPGEEYTTIEDVFEDLDRVMETGVQTLYVIDSLDALSDRAEQKRDIDAGSYAMTKQKKLSELFRRSNAKMSRGHVTLMIVSQVRDAIGVVFGDKHKRSGGKALDFYASQIVWLANKGKIKRTKKKVERSIGIRVMARCKKNKIGNPHLDCEFPLIFGYGVEDVEAGLDWLIKVNRTASLSLTEDEAKKLIKALPKLSQEDYDEERGNVSDAVRRAWWVITDEFKHTRSKY